MAEYAEYIDKNAAIIEADYAADEHPYEKREDKPETFSEYNQGWNDACDYIRDMIEDLPAIDIESGLLCKKLESMTPEQFYRFIMHVCKAYLENEKEERHGRWAKVRWVECDDPDGGYWIVRCSQCDIPNNKDTRFCPHCGSKMDLEEE